MESPHGKSTSILMKIQVIAGITWTHPGEIPIPGLENFLGCVPVDL